MTLPLLTRSLGLAEYGRWALVEPIVAVASQCATLGIPFWIIKAVARDGRDPATVFASMSVACIPVAVAVGGIAAVVTHGDLRWVDCVALAVWCVAEAGIGLVFSTLRCSDRPTAFGAVTVVKAMSWLVVLVVARRGSFTVSDAIRWSAVCASAATALGAFMITLKRHGPLLAARDQYVPAVRYGAPMLVAALLLVASTLFERWFIAWQLDAATVGTFVVHAKVAAIAQPIFSAPLALWWPTARFKHIGSPDRGEAFFATTSLVVLWIYLSLAALLWFAASPLIAWFAPSVSLDGSVMAGQLVTMICIGMANPLNVGLLESGRTHLNLYGVAGGVVVQFAANLALVPHFGVSGAAWAAAVGAFASMAILNGLSQVVHPIRFPYALLVGQVAIVVGVVAVLGLGLEAVAWPVRIGCTVALGVAGLGVLRRRIALSSSEGHAS